MGCLVLFTTHQLVQDFAGPSTVCQKKVPGPKAVFLFLPQGPGPSSPPEPWLWIHPEWYSKNDPQWWPWCDWDSLLLYHIDSWCKKNWLELGGMWILPRWLKRFETLWVPVPVPRRQDVETHHESVRTKLRYTISPHGLRPHFAYEQLWGIYPPVGLNCLLPQNSCWGVMRITEEDPQPILVDTKIWCTSYTNPLLMYPLVI